MSSEISPAERQIVVTLSVRMLQERRRLLVGLSLGAFTLALLTTALYSSLGAEYSALLEDMPAALLSMLGNAEMGTLEGWLQVEVFSLMGPGLVLGAAIAVGAGTLGGAEQESRLALITAAPMRRRSVVSAALVAVIVAAVVVSYGLAVGILIAAQLASLTVSAGHVLTACLSLTLLGTAVGVFALMVSAATASRGVAAAAATSVAVASYAINAFFPLSELLAPYAKVSLWHPFASNQPLINGVRLLDVGVLTAFAGLAALVAYRGFERRDLTA